MSGVYAYIKHIKWVNEEFELNLFAKYLSLFIE
jgi:hypothetical protein